LQSKEAEVASVRAAISLRAANLANPASCFGQVCCFQGQLCFVIFVSVLGGFSALDENEHFRKGQPFLENRMEMVHDSFIV
jgi:hypothetical protein